MYLAICPRATKVVCEDGMDNKSNHNHYPSRAFDVAVNLDIGDLKRHISWDINKYEPLLPICSELGLISGGSWQSIVDWPHVELRKEIV